MSAVEAHTGLLVRGRFPELEVALCERVRELKRDEPLAPLVIVVGSGAVRTRVGDVLVRRLGGIANVRIVTFGGFAAGLIAQQDAGPPAGLTGLARERFVRRVVSAEAGRLTYYGPVVDKPHFAAALASTISDLREGCVDAATAWPGSVHPSPGQGTPPNRAAVADLALLYAAYCREMDRAVVVDGAGVILAAADLLGRHEHLGPHTIVYGIYDLNRAQERLAEALLRGGADAFVPVPRGADVSALALLAVARDAGLGEEALQPAAPSRDLDLVSGVWSLQHAGRRDRLEPAGDGTLEVVSVPDERAEAREAVRAVVTAVEHGTRLYDCAVVVPRDEHVPRLAAAFTAAGVSVACRLPESGEAQALLHRLAECLSPQAGEAFARRAVVDLLQTAPLKDGAPAPEDAALWLDEARQAGVVCGLDQWTERVSARRRYLERRVPELEQAQDACGDDEDGGERLESTRLRLRASSGLQAAVAALGAASRRLPARRAGWGEWAAALAKLVNEVFCPEAAERAADVLGRLQSFAVIGEEVDLADALGGVRDLLAAATISHNRVGREGVALLTPLELRGLSFSTVVFTGLAEGGFPVRGRPDPLLGDGLRRGLNELPGIRLPLAEERDAESALLFGLVCEAARDRLLLLAPRTDAGSGRPRLPSRFTLRLASLAAGVPVGQEEYLSGRPLSAVWRHVGGAPAFAEGAVWVDGEERDVAALLALSQSGARRSALAYLQAVLGDTGAADRRLSAWRASQGSSVGPWDGLLDARARAALAARHPFSGELHPTSLERYITCPWVFLLRGVYGLEAPEEPGDSLDMDAMQYGSLVHAILEDVYLRVIEDDLDLEGALAAADTAWDLRCAEAERSGITGAALAWEVRRDLLREDLRESIRRDPVFAADDGRPRGVEWRFGDRHAIPVVLTLDDGREARFSGRLDRVDQTADGARVVDYKTGAGSTEKDRLKDGLSVQLPVYQLAVRQAWGALVPGEEQPASITSLYRLVSRKGGFRELDLTQDEPSAQARLRELVARAMALVDEGCFPRTTRGRCEFCDVGYACGVSEWARARKRESDELDSVVGLQGPAPKDGGGDDG
jgi:hypothetical protein